MSKKPTSWLDQLPSESQWILDGQAILLAKNAQPEYQMRLNDAIAELAGKLAIVGYDWIGRPFGIATYDSGAPTMLIYEPIFDELMEFDLGEHLTASRLFEADADCFGKDEFRSFLKKAKLKRLELGTCAGFTVPPQLGGEVSATNLELYDVFFYWGFASLLHDSLSTLPPGTVLRSLKVK